MFTGQNPQTSSVKAAATNGQPATARYNIGPLGRRTSAWTSLGRRASPQNPNMDPNASPGNNTKNNANPNGSGLTASQLSGPSSSILQQILVPALLYQTLTADRNRRDGSVPAAHDTDLATLHYVEVHALESGGELLTNSNLFLGSRLYFGGGVVATFGVFSYAGAFECGGVAYAYQGYVEAKDVGKVLASNDADEKVKAKIKSNCAKISP